jgi:hypothetical protein
MIVQGSFRDWLASVSPPPLSHLTKRERSEMTEVEVKRFEALDRKVIDPRRINQFIDPEKEGSV